MRPSRGRRRRPARGVVEDKAPKRRAGLILAIVTVMLVLAASASGYLVNKFTPATVTTQTVTPSAAPATWKLALPVTIGEYSRDANVGASPVVGADKKQTVSAPYTKAGQPAVVMVLSRPHADGKLFMQEANMNAVVEMMGTTPENSGWCGVSGDNNLDGCALIRDDTAVMVLAVQDISRVDLMALVVEVADTIDG